MKRIYWILMLATAAGCSDAPDLSIPPVAVGGGGARLMTGGARTPFEAYDNAFGSMTKLHLQLQDGLRPPTNRAAIGGALDDICSNLELMQSLAIPEQRDRFNDLILKYGEWRAAFRRGITNGMSTDVSELERRMRVSLGLSRITLIDELPAAAKPPVKKPEEPLIPKKDPDPEAKPEPPVKPDPAPPAKDAQFWMIYAAWKQTHADLVAAYTKKGDWQAAFGKVFECLAAMKPRIVPESAQATLQLYTDQYKRIKDTITKGGTDAKEEFVLKDLEVVSSLIEHAFNPEKK